MSGGNAATTGGEGLVVRGLSVGYRTERGLLHVLDDVDLTVPPGTVVGLVGESGSGKSTLAYSIVRYLSDNARVLGGSVTLDGEDLLGAAGQRLRELRGAAIGMVYQDPGTALNPTLRLGEQLTEGPRRHQGLDRKGAAARGAELLDMVRLPDPRFIMRRFPHESSGGEKQRVLIAMAFACQPRLLIFDEPTTALDATTAAGILDLIRGLQEDTGAAVLYITHDLGNVARVAQRVNVIYAGRIVEEGRVGEVAGPAAASLYPGPHGQRAQPLPRERTAPAARLRRPPPGPALPARRLHLRGPLPFRGRPLPPRHPAPAAAGSRPPRGLPSRRRDRG